MKTRNKVLVLMLSAVLLVATSVFGTMAYLTDETDEVVNTFTIGEVELTLDETDVNVYGVKDGETRVTENTYKLMPGHEYVKDPIVHVGTDSEDSYLFVTVENPIAEIESTTADTIAEQMEKNDWILFTDASGNSIYYYEEVVKADTDVNVFEKFTVNGEVGAEELKLYEGLSINIKAYAVQADGFTDDAEAAWNATWGKPETTTP